MADETIVNGVASVGDDRTAENFYDFDRESDTSKVSDLIRKIEALEQEKLELVRKNEETREMIKKSTVEIEGLRSGEAKMKERLGEMEREIERSESDKKALEAVAARAMELETEVSRMQHDLISAMSDGDEANAEVKELKRMLEEKGLSIESLEREKERLEIVVEEAKKAKAMSDSKVRELEKRIEDMKERESDGKSEKVRVEEEAKARNEEKEREICGLKKGIEKLESAIAKSALELEKSMKEKKEMEGLKNGLEEALRFSEAKVKEMESKMIQLQQEVKEAEKVISGLKEKTIDAINGPATIATRALWDDEGKGLKLQWPIMAAGGTIVVAAVVCYLHYGRRR
ncbi:hypothetical protein L1049_023546 [Liquidambar formosana]|uniref:Peroxisomal and mitochondrial division factor 2-like n=1 Tax=Liquidambar formosana TaxID=63359 RepID=A0AAP0S083_LIQFO